MKDAINDTDFNYINVVGADADFKKKHGINRLIDTLTNVFSVPKRTYPDDPEYGSSIHKFCFDPADEITMDNIRDEVKYIIMVYGHGSRMLNLDISFLSDRKGFVVNIKLEYQGETKEVKLQITDDRVMRLM